MTHRDDDEGSQRNAAKDGTITDYAQEMETWLKEGKYDQMITSSTTVLEANPNSVRPYEFRARAYIEKGESDLAIADCQKALALYPDNGEVKLLMRRARQGVQGSRRLPIR